jgi:hypothetical protein
MALRGKVGPLLASIGLTDGDSKIRSLTRASNSLPNVPLRTLPAAGGEDDST